LTASALWNQKLSDDDPEAFKDKGSIQMTKEWLEKTLKSTNE
jgi:hypothetical protein